ncbi:hypothetical protein [Aureliella helgolandensis]|uniref:Uncharacterized protein n=1 Tax=Aureliella helgolandensis TaxID=2527968 RepID=A0A518G358_9BACT|nr:hypothetical protein [Aureliella helgolandensis]QDV23033.1 hypothetical protein Q31a_13260 [Aureliella helgolandensis]
MTRRTLNCDLLPKLSRRELSELFRWNARCAFRTAENAFHPWLSTVFRDEFARREHADGSAEPGMVEIPEEHLRFMSDALVACHGLARSPLSDAQAKFADSLELQVVSQVATILACIDETHHLTMEQ